MVWWTLYTIDVDVGVGYNYFMGGYTHGTVYSWMKKKCTCDMCRAAKQEFYDSKNAARRLPISAGGRGTRKTYGRRVDHGDPLSYTRGCRCDDCREANALRERERRWMKRRGKVK